MKPQVRILSSDEHAIWPEALALSGGFIGLDSWMEFVERIYGYRAYRLAAQTGGEITGLLALTHVRHPIFGNYLATAPFGSYGGFAFSSIEARDALLDHASALMKELGVDYANVRFEACEATPPAGWIQHPVYATYRAELSSHPEEILSAYSSDHRNHIRKSLKKGFTLKFGHLDLLDDAYEALTRSMHELGSPYHSKNYLRGMAESFGETLEFAVLSDPNGKLAGAGVFIFQGDVVTNLHANILRRFRSDYAGEFLYWSVITRYGQKGFRIFDMGRSLIGSGNEVFKSKWRPTKHLLAYWYSLREGRDLPGLNQKNPKFRIAIWIWQRLPNPIVQFLGPSLIRGLA
ncbi:MAG: GNAT family N-acetyltransferase [Chloroflexi bacterium]|nr:GNAT family N-acetyltransferase [Chloroflexota bacterium]